MIRAALLATMFVAGACAVVSADPIVPNPMHGYSPPAIVGGEAARLDLLHIGPITIAERPIWCRVAPCPRPIVVRAGDIHRQTAGKPRVLSLKGDMIDIGDDWSGFGRLWENSGSGALLIEEVKPPARVPETIVLHNRTGLMARGAFVTSASTDHWGDVMSDNFVSGRSMTLPVKDPHCLQDIRVRLDYPGDELLLMGVDICATAMITLTTTTGQRIERVE